MHVEFAVDRMPIDVDATIRASLPNTTTWIVVGIEIATDTLDAQDVAQERRRGTTTGLEQ